MFPFIQKLVRIWWCWRLTWNSPREHKYVCRSCGMDALWRVKPCYLYCVGCDAHYVQLEGCTLNELMRAEEEYGNDFPSSLPGYLDESDYQRWEDSRKRNDRLGVKMEKAGIRGIVKRRKDDG